MFYTITVQVWKLTHEENGCWASPASEREVRRGYVCKNVLQCSLVEMIEMKSVDISQANLCDEQVTLREHGCW